MAELEEPVNTQPTPLACNEICWRMIVWIISLVIIVINVAVDTLTLILYFGSDEYAFFTLTLVFLSMPLLVIATASLIWLRDEDRRRDENARAEDGKFTAASVALHVALLGLAHRYGRLIMKGAFKRSQAVLVKSWERDAHLLMLIQTILHCCSQCVVQLYIIADDDHESTYIPFTILCAAVNFTAVVWAVFIYILYNMFKTSNINLLSKFVIFTWHMCIIVSRILALAFFTVAYHAFVFIPFGVHWISCSVALFFLSTDFCSDITVQPHKKRRYLELPYDTVIGYMLLFFYFNAKKGRTWCTVTLYHVLTFVETLILSITFYIEKPNKWYSLLILCATILLFLIGAALILLYYLMLHPKTKQYLVTWNMNRRIHHINGSTVKISADQQESNDS